MPAADPERRRPRAVADLPALDPDAVAKAWLLELLRGVPLDQAARVPTARIAQDGPALAAALLDALGTDGALGALDAHAARAAALTGATDAGGLVAAFEALRSAVWRLLRPDEDVAAAASDRLAHLCSRALEAALDGASSGSARATGEPSAPSAGGDAPVPPPLVRPPYDDWEPADGPPLPAVAPHDAAILRRLDVFRRDGRPFSVVLVEVDDADRLLAAQHDEEAGAALDRAEQAVAAALRPGDLLTRESPGRLWVTAPDTAGLAARDLASRLAGAVPGAAALNGAALRASAGVAVCPDDGKDGEALVGTAEERLLNARAAGLPLV